MSAVKKVASLSFLVTALVVGVATTMALSQSAFTLDGSYVLPA